MDRPPLGRVDLKENKTKVAEVVSGLLIFSFNRQPQAYAYGSTRTPAADG